MPRQIQGSQFDFSYGEVDPDLKRRDDHPARKAGMRQMSNARIHNSGTIQNRPGRRALFLENGRVEKFTMSGGTIFYIAFGTGYLRIYDVNGVRVANQTVKGDAVTPLPWTNATVVDIVWVLYQKSIYITYGDDFPNNQPQILTWDGVSTWTLASYLGGNFPGYGRRVPFYHISPSGIALWPSAGSGSVTLTASAPLFSASWVGVRINFAYRQLIVTAYTDPTHVTATVSSLTLPTTAQIGWAAINTGLFQTGQIVLGSISGAKGVVVATDATRIYLLYLTEANFVTTDTIVGQTGNSGGATLGIVGVTYASITTAGITIWDDEAMNNLRGWPRSCFIDQGRLGFCDFPAVPPFIVWSAFGDFLDIYTDPANVGTANAILEIAPGNSRVLYVVPGMESSEFVFCDHSLYYIKIDATNPLRPGSVGFQTLSGDGASRVQPRISQNFIFYVNAGGNSVRAVTAQGAYYRPFNTRNMCDFHSHLFSNIVALAAPNADGTLSERYLYALNADGTMVCGKYNNKDSQLSDDIGWCPWSGIGAVNWIAATNDDIIFVTSYFGTTVCEVLDDTVYMDGSVFVNAAPTALAPPVGKGPLWIYAGQSVFLMDQVTRPMGVYQVDANGFIIPQNNGGENLAAATLVAGQIWTGVAEPFAPDAPSGQDQHQRMELRQYSYFGVYVTTSTGLVFNAIFSGKQTRLGPVVGSVTNTSRRPSYNMDDDTTLPPIQRETVEKWTPPGSSYDPRCAVVWDTPGPIQILEFAMEISI